MRIHFVSTFILCAAIAAIAVPTVSHAGVFCDGYKLKGSADAHDRTSSGHAQPMDYPLSGYFTGYVAGVNDTLDGIAICTPQEVKLGEMLGIVKKYLRKNPDKWYMPGSVIVIKALSSAFPCKKGKIK